MKQHGTKNTETSLSNPREEAHCSATNTGLLVDGHVHFHDCFTWEVFLEAAAANFADVRQKLRMTNDSPGCLMLTESAGANYYGALLNKPEFVTSLGWRVTATDKDGSMILSRDEGDTIVIVAGRQIVTAENLEVLALGCTREFPDGQPIRKVLDAVVDSNATAVIPWGFGKWWGRRGRTLLGILLSDSAPPFFLGDNAGRLCLGSRPALFAEAETRGVFVLPGSDPLPFLSEVRRLGSYGFLLPDWEESSRPAKDFMARLRRLSASPRAFGNLTTIPRFCRMQLAMQWRKRSQRTVTSKSVGW